MHRPPIDAETDNPDIHRNHNRKSCSMQKYRASRLNLIPWRLKGWAHSRKMP
jgi:hypothetical protein